MIRLILTLMFWIISFFSTVFAQNYSGYIINGTIEAPKLNSIEVYLFTPEDQLIKTEIVSKEGKFSFSEVKAGMYKMKISQEGIEVYSTVLEINQNTTLASISLKEQKIDEVTIVKSKPYIERQDGKMILNVENSIVSTGNTALEVLEKAPGVNIDPNENISLRGKSNIIIQIDGKNTPMAGTELAGYLRGISSTAIDKIEFITNPSSKYDAEGTSIINIKLKKSQRKGTHGSITSSFGIGKYIKNNNGFNINYRKNKVNLFANYNFGYREYYNKLILDRSFYENTVFQKAYLQNNFAKINNRSHLIKTGLDYYINDKNILGISLGYSNSGFNPTGNNETQVLDNQHQPAGSFKTQSHNADKRTNATLNINHKLKLDSLGSELTTDLDFLNFKNSSIQNFISKNYNVQGVPNAIPYILDGDLAGNLNIYSLKSDFSKVLKNDWKLETGLKTSFVKADNDLKYYDSSTGNPVLDPTKTNHFIYKENINAVYGNIIKNWEKFKFNFGLRVENTNITGNQATTQEINTKSYTQWFPSAVFSYDVSDKHSIELNLSRRISRPTYGQLNPFKFYLDPTTYEVGNPNLNPQTTMNYELTYSISNKYFATLSYSKISNNITDVLMPVVENGNIVVVQANENLNTASYYGLNIIAPFKIAKWWDMNNNANFYFGRYTGNISGTPIKNQGNFTFDLNTNNTFKLGNGFTAELSANYKAKEVYAYMHLKPMWSVNIGAQKKFKNNSTLKISFTDIFLSSKPEAQNIYANYIENFIVRRDTRFFTLSYTYNFGSGKTSSQRKTGGADDLKQRAS